MNAAKHMELIFIATLALVSASTLASASVPLAHTAQRITVTEAQLQAPRAVPMTVVTVSAKRLSVAQKAALGN